MINIARDHLPLTHCPLPVNLDYLIDSRVLKSSDKRLRRGTTVGAHLLPHTHAQTNHGAPAPSAHRDAYVSVGTSIVTAMNEPEIVVRIYSKTSWRTRSVKFLNIFLQILHDFHA